LEFNDIVLLQHCRIFTKQCNLFVTIDFHCADAFIMVYSNQLVASLLTDWSCLWTISTKHCFWALIYHVQHCLDYPISTLVRGWQAQFMYICRQRHLQFRVHHNQSLC